MKAEATYKKALDLAKRTDHSPEEVLGLLNQAYEDGNPKAAYALGTWYLFGKNVRKSLKKAVEYLTIAADANVPEAAYDLAVCFENGSGVTKDVNKAFQLYLKSALLGDSDAKYEAARCFYYGIGVDKDESLAKLMFDSKKLPLVRRRSKAFAAA